MLTTNGAKAGAKELMKPTNQKVSEAVAKVMRDKAEETEASPVVVSGETTPEGIEAESTAVPPKVPEVKVAAKAKGKPAKTVAKAKVGAKASKVVKARVVKAKATKPAKPVKAAKAAKEAKVVKAKAAKPTSGQSGPALTLRAADLNKNETKLLCSFGDYKGGEEIGIAELAKETFPSKPKATANSWVRNALRRLVRAWLVDKTDRGTYKLTKAGRSLV
jgi:hypothetical protein